METMHVKLTHCKSCGHEIDCHSSVEGDHKPSEGDLSVCLYCGVISKFDEDMNIIALSTDEKNDLMHDHPEAWKTISKMHEFIDYRIKNN